MRSAIIISVLLLCQSYGKGQVNSYNYNINLHHFGDLLPFAGWRTSQEVYDLSMDDKRNITIIEMHKHSNKPIVFFQAMNNLELIGNGWVAAVLIKRKYRTPGEMKNISPGDQRNTLIVEINKRQGKAIPYLQSLDNFTLVKTDSEIYGPIQGFQPNYPAAIPFDLSSLSEECRFAVMPRNADITSMVEAFIGKNLPPGCSGELFEIMYSAANNFIGSFLRSVPDPAAVPADKLVDLNNFYRKGARISAKAALEYPKNASDKLNFAWKLIPVSGTGFYYIVSPVSDNYRLHIERGRVEAGKIHPGAFSAMWRVVPVPGQPHTFQLVNRWKNTHKIHCESGKLEASPIADSAHTSWWVIKALPK